MSSFSTANNLKIKKMISFFSLVFPPSPVLVAGQLRKEFFFAASLRQFLLNLYLCNVYFLSSGGVLCLLLDPLLLLLHPQLIQPLNQHIRAHGLSGLANSRVLKKTNPAGFLLLLLLLIFFVSLGFLGSIFFLSEIQFFNQNEPY